MTRHFGGAVVVGMTCFCFVCLVGCDLQRRSANGSAPTVDAPVPTTEGIAEFSNQLLAIANTYESYEPAFPDKAHKFRVSPLPCAPSAPPPQPSLGLSASMDSSTHGRKLYTVFVKEFPKNPPTPESDDRHGLRQFDEDKNYAAVGQPNPIGQIVVKESWKSEEVDATTPLTPAERTVYIHRGEAVVEESIRFIPYAKQGDHLYHAVSKAELFIMFKRDPKTPGTDEGWVYGTVSTDRKQVLTVGRVESCMGCHRDAPYDRLFGHPKK